MILPSEITHRYNAVEPYLSPLLHNVRDTLASYCEKNNFALVSRVKSVDSVAEKIESGRYAKWSDLDDLIAFTVIIPTLLQEDGVLEFLNRSFSPVTLKRRGSTKKAPDVFRFDSTRFIAKLTAPPGETARPIHEVKFEIQIRTAFDHAWVVTTHALTYKSKVVDWKQQRLAAELKATAEKMDLLILTFVEASSRVEESPWPIIAAKKAIQEFFSKAFDSKRMPEVLAPKDWSRFTDNVYDLGSRCGSRLEPDEVVSMVTNAVQSELGDLGPEKVPLSLSLWQFTLAALNKKNPLKPQSLKYWPLITPQMEDIYPQTKKLNQRFDLNS